MVSLKVNDVKTFMNKLLIQSVFDNFLVSEVEVVTSNKFTIDGFLQKSYYNSDELEALDGRVYSTWGELRPFVYQIIKGHRTPTSFRMILQLNRLNTEKVVLKGGVPLRVEDVGGLFLNIRFEQNSLVLVTGTSIKVFTLDKSLDQVWDKDMKVFLKYNEILVEEI